MTLVEMSAFRGDEEDPLVKVIRPLPPQAQPSEAFVYWTRRMLCNVMRSSTIVEEAVRQAS